MHDDVPEIARAISDMYQDFVNNRLHGSVTSESVYAYSIGSLARKLSQVLDLVAGHATEAVLA